MKTKTNELTGAALNWAVAKCEGYEDKDFCPHDKHYRDEDNKWYSPADDWSQGGPIIEREGMLIEFHGDHWCATIWWDDGDSAKEVTQKGPTPLIAAMRCYVASKLGDEVDVPEGLS